MRRKKENFEKKLFPYPDFIEKIKKGISPKYSLYEEVTRMYEGTLQELTERAKED